MVFPTPVQRLQLDAVHRQCDDVHLLRRLAEGQNVVLEAFAAAAAVASLVDC